MIRQDSLKGIIYADGGSQLFPLALLTRYVHRLRDAGTRTTPGLKYARKLDKTTAGARQLGD